MFIKKMLLFFRIQMRQRRRWIRLPIALGSLAFIGVIFLIWQFLGLHFITKEETTNLVRAKQVYDIVVKDA
jgi:amino acid permease